jgi:hypothetical protein
MSVITLFFWIMIIRFILFLLFLMSQEYPRKIKPISIGSDIGSIIICILLAVWLGLVKYGVIGVNL